MRNLLAFGLGVAVLGLLGFGAAEGQKEPAVNQPPTVSVSGTGDAQRAPDQATVRIGVQAEAGDAKTAQARVNEATTRLIAAAKNLVADPKDIQTSDLSLFPQYDGNPARVRGYQARNVVTVRLKNVDRVGPLLDAGVAVGATNIEGVSFGLQDPAPARDEALEAAVKDARRKAEAIARGLGMKLGAVVSVDEGGGNFPRPMEMDGFAARGAMKASAPVEAGEVGVGATVSVRFRLE